MAPTPPSTIISNALGSFTKAVNLALNTIDEQAKADVAHANAERDDALKELHELQLEEKEWEIRVEGWKAALDKSDLTVKHQAETISQLRSEIQQWKNQLMRLEESSRQEILSWRDQYVRAEQERCRMSSRIDELVAEQLDWNTQANGTTPYTPKPQTSPTATKRASSSAHSLPALPTHKRLTPHARVPEDPTVSPRKIKSGVKPKPPIQADREVVYRQSEEYQATPGRSQKRNTTADAQLNARHKPQPRNSVAHLASHEPQSHPRQQVIRRVKAVIEVPVKEEDEDDHVLEAEESSASGSAYEPDDLPVRPVGARRKRQPRASAKGKEVQANWLEEDDSGEEQAVVRQVDEDDDDVDELVMGSENPREVRPTQEPVTPTAKRRSVTVTRPAGSGKRRKLDADSGGPSGRGTSTRHAKARA